MRVPAWLVARTWASVLAAMNSTATRPVSIIRLTALLPPPPSPITRMTALSLFICYLSWPSEKVLEYVPDAVEQAASATGPAFTLRAGGPCGPGALPGGLRLAHHGVTYEADGGGVDGAGHHVDEAADAVRFADPDRQAETVRSHLVEAGHEG